MGRLNIIALIFICSGCFPTMRGIVNNSSSKIFISYYAGDDQISGISSTSSKLFQEPVICELKALQDRSGMIRSIKRQVSDRKIKHLYIKKYPELVLVKKVLEPGQALIYYGYFKHGPMYDISGLYDVLFHSNFMVLDGEGGTILDSEKAARIHSSIENCQFIIYDGKVEK